MKPDRKLLISGVILAIVFCVLALGELAFGSVSLSLSRIIGGLTGADKTAGIIIIDLRLPRLFAAILAGAGLAVAGLLLQTVTGNELCAPSIIGVNSGAGLFVMAFICLFPMLWRWLPFAAFLGALTATGIIIFTVRFENGIERKSSLILVGVAVSSVMSAGISFLSVRFPEALPSYTAFSVGGFSGITMNMLPIPAIIITLGTIAAIIFAPKTGLLRLGDETAATLGVNVKATRSLAVIISSALCAAVVSFAGLLGFVGLVVPNIIRMLFGSRLRVNIIFSVGFGAALTLFSDILGRTIFAPGELPAGIIMAFIGAPFFIYLIVRKRRHV